jgi:hypothetical protein
MTEPLRIFSALRLSQMLRAATGRGSGFKVQRFRVQRFRGSRFRGSEVQGSGFKDQGRRWLEKQPVKSK